MKITKELQDQTLVLNSLVMSVITDDSEAFHSILTQSDPDDAFQSLVNALYLFKDIINVLNHNLYAATGSMIDLQDMIKSNAQAILNADIVASNEEVDPSQ